MDAINYTILETEKSRAQFQYFYYLLNVCAIYKRPTEQQDPFSIGVGGDGAKG